jgi:hypothetical protein
LRRDRRGRTGCRHPLILTEPPLPWQNRPIVHMA